MRVMVIPVEEDEKKDEKKPVGIVEPMGPSLDQQKSKQGKTKGSKMLKTKRLDSVLSGIHAKKGFKAENNVNEAEQDNEGGFDLGANSECFQMKTMDGTSSIKIIKKVDDETNTLTKKKSSVSSSIQSESSDAERKVSTDSDKQLSSPPALEELEPIMSSEDSETVTSNTSSGHQSPKPEPVVKAKPQVVTSRPTPPQPPQPPAPTTKQPVQKVGKPRGRPPGSKNVEKRRLDEQVGEVQVKGKMNGIPNKRAKQQTQPNSNNKMGNGRQTGPKMKKTKEPPTVMKTLNKGSYKGPPPPNYDHHPHYPPQKVAYQQNGEYPERQHFQQRETPKYRSSYPAQPRQTNQHQTQSPYVYASPSQAPIRPAAPPPPPTTVSPIAPKVIPTFNEVDDDAPLDLTMYSKKRQNGTLKTPSPPEPKKPTPQRVQNQPLNLKRISSGKVIASVNVTKMKTPSPVKRDPRPTAPTPPPRQTVPYRNRMSSKEDFEPKSRVVSAPPPPVQSSPVKMTPPSSRLPPPQKLKSINMAGKHVVSVANVKCQKRAPPPSKPSPTPNTPTAPTTVEEKPKKPKMSKKSSAPPKPDKETTAEDKSILVHRGKTIEQRLNMEFANKEREEKEKAQKPVETKDEDDSITVSQTEEDKQLNPDSSQYAPRTVSDIILMKINDLTLLYRNIPRPLQLRTASGQLSKRLKWQMGRHAASKSAFKVPPGALYRIQNCVKSNK